MVRVHWVGGGVQQFPRDRVRDPRAEGGCRWHHHADVQRRIGLSACQMDVVMGTGYQSVFFPCCVATRATASRSFATADDSQCFIGDFFYCFLVGGNGSLIPQAAPGPRASMHRRKAPNLFGTVRWMAESTIPGKALVQTSDRVEQILPPLLEFHVYFAQIEKFRRPHQSERGASVFPQGRDTFVCLVVALG